MQTIFLQAKNKLIEDFACPIVNQRITTIQLNVTHNTGLIRHLSQDNYCRASQIPAYYDPNIHTIFLNLTSMKRLPEQTVYVICYHELVHGASLHTSYELPGVNVFQSGVKFERYVKRRYHCFNRLLNEGIVQFLTTELNHLESRDYAYAREVDIVRELAKKVGKEVVKKALLYEQYTQLKTRFEEYFGSESFTTFTRYIDKRAYQKAYYFLQSPKASFVS